MADCNELIDRLSDIDKYRLSGCGCFFQRKPIAIDGGPRDERFVLRHDSRRNLIDLCV